MASFDCEVATVVRKDGTTGVLGYTREEVYYLRDCTAPYQLMWSGIPQGEVRHCGEEGYDNWFDHELENCTFDECDALNFEEMGDWSILSLSDNPMPIGEALEIELGYAYWEVAYPTEEGGEEFEELDPFNELGACHRDTDMTRAIEAAEELGWEVVDFR